MMQWYKRVSPVFITGLLLWLLPAAATSQENPSIETLLEEAEQLNEQGNKEQALGIYLIVLDRSGQNYEALWNSGLLYVRKGHRHPSPDIEKEYYLMGLDLAGRCLELYPERSRCHYVYGVAAASLADDMSNSRERIELVREAKEYATRAAELDPDYAPVWHLKGVWHSKMSTVSRTERLGARLLYGGLPEGASQELAETYLMKAIEMKPDVILFHLDLGQHYQDAGQVSRARPVLEHVLSLQAVSEDDRLYQQEAQERLSEIGN